MVRAPAVAFAAMAIWAVSSVPPVIEFWFKPKTMKFMVLPLMLVLTDFPAEVMIDPAVTVPELSPAGKLMLNCRLATDAEPGFKVRGKLTVVPALPLTEPAERIGATTGAGGGGGGAITLLTLTEMAVVVRLPATSRATALSV